MTTWISPQDLAAGEPGSFFLSSVQDLIVEHTNDSIHTRQGGFVAKMYKVHGARGREVAPIQVLPVEDPEALRERRRKQGFAGSFHVFDLTFNSTRLNLDIDLPSFVLYGKGVQLKGVEVLFEGAQATYGHLISAYLDGWPLTWVARELMTYKTDVKSAPVRT